MEKDKVLNITGLEVTKSVIENQDFNISNGTFKFENISEEKLQFQIVSVRIYRNNALFSKIDKFHMYEIPGYEEQQDTIILEAGESKSLDISFAFVNINEYRLDDFDVKIVAENDDFQLTGISKVRFIIRHLKR